MPNRKRKEKGLINGLRSPPATQLSEHSPSPQRYGLSAAGAHDHGPSASSTRTESESVAESVAVAVAVLAATGQHSHHAQEMMTTRCC